MKRLSSEGGPVGIFKCGSRKEKYLIQRKPEVAVSVSITYIFTKPRWLNIFVQFVWGGPGMYIWMCQSKREISRECNDIIGSAKGTCTEIQFYHRHLFHSKNICPLLFLTSRQTSSLFPFPISPQYFSLICDPFADPIQYIVTLPRYFSFIMLISPQM
jgi:hypothetical protein